MLRFSVFNNNYYVKIQILSEKGGKGDSTAERGGACFFFKVLGFGEFKIIGIKRGKPLRKPSSICSNGYTGEG